MNILIYPARVETEFMDISSTQHIYSIVWMEWEQDKKKFINQFSDSETLGSMELWPAPFESSTKENYRTFLITIKINHQKLHCVCLLMKTERTLKKSKSDWTLFSLLIFDANDKHVFVIPFEGFPLNRRRIDRENTLSSFENYILYPHISFVSPFFFLLISNSPREILCDLLFLFQILWIKRTTTKTR